MQLNRATSWACWQSCPWRPWVSCWQNLSQFSGCPDAGRSGPESCYGPPGHCGRQPDCPPVGTSRPTNPWWRNVQGPHTGMGWVPNWHSTQICPLTGVVCELVASQQGLGLIPRRDVEEGTFSTGTMARLYSRLTRYWNGGLWLRKDSNFFLWMFLEVYWFMLQLLIICTKYL